MHKPFSAKLKTLFCLAVFVATTSFSQNTVKPITNEDVINLVKAGLPADTIILTIKQSKTAFDTSPNGLIALSKNGVTGPVLNAVVTASSSASASIPAPPTPIGLDAPCPEKSGVYFNDGSTWKPLFQAASAGSQTKMGFGSAKSSVIYMGAEASVVIPPRPTFCFREIKPDLGMSVVKLDMKKDHRELQTAYYNGFAPGVGNGVNMKNIIRVIARPAEGDDDVTVVQLPEPLLPGQYLILAQNPLYATMPASVPMSMRIGIGYDFGVK